MFCGLAAVLVLVTRVLQTNNFTYLLLAFLIVFPVNIGAFNVKGFKAALLELKIVYQCCCELPSSNAQRAQRLLKCFLVLFKGYCSLSGKDSYTRQCSKIVFLLSHMLSFVFTRQCSDSGFFPLRRFSLCWHCYASTESSAV